jgi:hypothetical protein
MVARSGHLPSAGALNRRGACGPDLTALVTRRRVRSGLVGVIAFYRVANKQLRHPYILKQLRCIVGASDRYVRDHSMEMPLGLLWRSQLGSGSYVTRGLVAALGQARRVMNRIDGGFGGSATPSIEGLRPRNAEISQKAPFGSAIVADTGALTRSVTHKRVCCETESAARSPAGVAPSRRSAVRWYAKLAEVARGRCRPIDHDDGKVTTAAALGQPARVGPPDYIVQRCAMANLQNNPRHSNGTALIFVVSNRVNVEAGGRAGLRRRGRFLNDCPSLQATKRPRSTPGPFGSDLWLG